MLKAQQAHDLSYQNSTAANNKIMAHAHEQIAAACRKGDFCTTLHIADLTETKIATITKKLEDSGYTTEATVTHTTLTVRWCSFSHPASENCCQHCAGL